MSREVSELLQAMERGRAVDLAARCGVSPPTVTKWKKRETTPDAAHWPVIEEFFGLEPGHLSRLGLGGSLADHVDQLQATLDRVQEEVDEVRRALGLPPRG